MSNDLFIIILIAVLFLITVVSLAASFMLRKKKGDRVDHEPPIHVTDKTLDVSFEACVTEINKLGTLVRSELDAKYKELLFLYGLIDEKIKEVNGLIEQSEKLISKASSAVSADEPPATAPPAFLFVDEDEWEQGDTHHFPPEVEAVPKNEMVFPVKMDSPHVMAREYRKTKKTPRFINEAHKKIWVLYEEGKEVPEIAKELGIGQGEVTLILNIAAS